MRPEEAKHGGLVKTTDEPAIRVPFISRPSLFLLIVAGIFGLVLAALSLAGITHGSPGRRVIGGTFGGLIFLVATFPFLQIARFAGRVLVMDFEGIWIESRSGRWGLAWRDVAGYAYVRERGLFLRVHSRTGTPLELPDAFGLDLLTERGTIVKALDQRLGADDIRPPMHRPESGLAQTIHDHYGMVPAVEMEPGLPYRYRDPRELSKTIREGMTSPLWTTGAMLLIFVMAVSRYPEFLPSFVLLALICVGSTVMFVQDLLLLRSLKDRFVRRGEVLIRIRGGEETILPTASPKPARYLMGQPLARHGRGPFAYRLAPQFLEPDV